MNTVRQYGVDYPITFRPVRESDIWALNDFDCGNPSINAFIKNCLSDSKDVTYLFYDDENEQIIGFCAICCNGISIVASDGKRKFHTSFPSVEIEFFAIDERYRSIPFDKDSGRYDTLSNALFLYAIGYIKNVVTAYIGATHVCLYAVPKAVNFYKRCGFVGFEEYMNRDETPFTENCVPMFMTL